MSDVCSCVSRMNFPTVTRASTRAFLGLCFDGSIFGVAFVGSFSTEETKGTEPFTQPQMDFMLNYGHVFYWNDDDDINQTPDNRLLSVNN